MCNFLLALSMFLSTLDCNPRRQRIAAPECSNVANGLFQYELIVSDPRQNLVCYLCRLAGRLLDDSVRWCSAPLKIAKIPRSTFNFSDSDSEMSYKDRGSPLLLESGLKSFLGHPGHNYPLINGESLMSYLQHALSKILN